MPKSSGCDYYVVSLGRSRSRIFDDWDECKDEVHFKQLHDNFHPSDLPVKMERYPKSILKCFHSLPQAERWLDAWTRTKSRRRRMPPKLLATHSEGEFEVERATHQRDDCDESNAVVPSRVISSQSTATFPFDTNLDPTSKGHADTLLDRSSLSLMTRSATSLSSEQIAVLDRVRAGENVFFTGSAGVGKSVLLREIIARCRDEGKVIAVTATTGIAAVNVGGCTLHSWAGIGIGKEARSKFVRKVCRDDRFQAVWKRWKRTAMLVIDEISMLDGRLFDKLESIARKLREDGRPFGGIQLVLCGDFCQLPPVSERDSCGEPSPVCFAFDALSWNRCVGDPMPLTKVFRQKDKRFIEMLHEMRSGELSRETIEVFRRLSREVKYDDGVAPTELYATRREVMNANAIRLDRLETEAVTYYSVDEGGYDSEGMLLSELRTQAVLDRLVCQEVLTLKIGAQVMLVKNLDQGDLVNGSVGIVTAFSAHADLKAGETETEESSAVSKVLHPDAGTPKSRSVASTQAYPVVEFIGGMKRVIVPTEFDVTNAEGAMEARRTQIPLILAWALSVHKSQGQTLERVKVDLRRIFEKGQVYVAVSRATSLEQLQVVNFDHAKVTSHPRVLEWYRGMRSPCNV